MTSSYHDDVNEKGPKNHSNNFYISVLTYFDIDTLLTLDTKYESIIFTWPPFGSVYFTDQVQIKITSYAME